MALIGDAAFRAGDLVLARRIYRAILLRVPTAAHIQARLGLADTPHKDGAVLLDALASLETRGAPAFISDGLATWKKTLPFLEYPRFVDLVAHHASLLPIPNWHWNLQTVVWAIEQTRNLEGDFVELGVFRGHTTLFCAELVGFRDWPKTWWLYDTFEGIPADQLDAGWAEKNAAAYGPEMFSFEEVRDRLAHIPNIRVIKGRVPEVLDQQLPEAISFLHMDMNNATAEIAALEKVFDRIVPGGVIVFDDYMWAAARTQYLAEKAWFAERGLVVLPLPTGQGVFMKGFR